MDGLLDFQSFVCIMLQLLSYIFSFLTHASIYVRYILKTGISVLEGVCICMMDIAKLTCIVVGPMYFPPARDKISYLVLKHPLDQHTYRPSEKYQLVSVT